MGIMEPWTWGHYIALESRYYNTNWNGEEVQTFRQLLKNGYAIPVNVSEHAIVINLRYIFKFSVV
jgi:hypothetical protein